MCIVLSAVVIALCRAIRVVCLHDVSMIVIGVEGADQGKEEPSSHHVAPGMSLPQQPSQNDLNSRKVCFDVRFTVDMLTEAGIPGRSWKSRPSYQTV
jgi:hypothetical protein